MFAREQILGNLSANEELNDVIQIVLTFLNPQKNKYIMKRIFLAILFSVFSVIVFAQELINPTVKIPFTESSGNFLVLTSFDKIGKSEITIDYVKNLRQELNDSKKLISEQQKLINEQKRSIEDLKKSINDLTRKIEDLRKKVK